MRIGVDVTCWTNPRGYGRVTRQLLSALIALPSAHEFVLFADHAAAELCDLEGPRVRIVRVAQGTAPTEAAVTGGNRSPLDLLRFTRAVARERLDVFFCPSVYTFFPLPPGLRAVVMIHDAIPERYPELTLPSRSARLFWRAKVALALRQANVVLTVSEFSRRELHDVFGLALDEIHVAVNAPSAAFRPSEDGTQVARAAKAAGVPPGAPWFVYLGGFNPHKHVDKIVRAHARLVRTLAEPPHALLVGKVEGEGWHGNQGAIRAAIEEEGTTDRVHWTGFVPDDTLRHLFSGAVASLLPSQLEGLGLPAVEAAACGTPCIATTESPLPELLEGGGLFVPPGDVDALEAAMRRLLTEPQTRQDMGRRARERVGAYTWERAARAALAAIETATGVAS